MAQYITYYKYYSLYNHNNIIGITILNIITLQVYIIIISLRYDTHEYQTSRRECLDRKTAKSYATIVGG